MEDQELNHQTVNGFLPPKKSKPKWRRFALSFWVLLLVAILIGLGGSLVYKTSFTFSQMNTENITDMAVDNPESMETPSPDSDRANYLLLGMRGVDDPNGGLLTDSIMVASIKKSTGQLALISVPRDLYVTMPGQNYKEKINFAHALGYEKKGAAGGLLLAKVAVSRATGLYIDRVAVVDHSAFKEIVDTLGGIDIFLDKPFVEEQQWVEGGDVGSSPFFTIQTKMASTSSGLVKMQKWVFKIPVGTSHLDGNTALYYVRARYSSNDFDRVQRQQQALLAMKNKALTLGVLGNPMKLFQIMDSLGKNIKTDMTLSDISYLVSVYPSLDTKNVFHKIFDTTPEGLLYSSTTPAGAYVLLPRGDDFSKIQEACKNIFNSTAD